MAVEVTVVRGWTVGYSRAHDAAIVRFDIGAAEPVVYALPVAAAQNLARALLQLDTAGQPTPRRPN